MNNYDYPIGSDNEFAPWNENEIPDCPECESSDVTFEIDGFVCQECGCEFEFEDPDFDMDDYADFDD